jgi:hypothetical protein
VTRKRPILASVVLILACGAIQMQHLQAASTSVLTESSSTSLTATLDRTNITNAGVDNWHLQLLASDLVNGSVSYWQEPGLTTTATAVQFLFGDMIPVTSDFLSPGPGFVITPNGGMDPITNGLLTVSGPQDLSVILDDNGDTAATPGPATIWYVLAVLVPVMAFRRKLGTLLRCWLLGLSNAGFEEGARGRTKGHAKKNSGVEYPSALRPHSHSTDARSARRIRRRASTIRKK